MRIALAGMGNVGAATMRLLQANGDVLAERCGEGIKIVAVSARSKGKDRDCDMTGIDWVDDPRALATRNDVDVVVEMIGGAEGAAYDLAKAALANGKHLVTANKTMVVAHGVKLAQVAEAKGLQFSFEAAVCGGTPVLKILREGMAANRITSVRGILNGTSNYILTRMGEDNLSFADALAEAQKLGYAEKDPANDIDGVDAANKLAILTAVAFGVRPDMSTMFVEGIRNVTAADIEAATGQKGRIKLLGITERDGNGISQRVELIFIPLSDPLARVGGACNFIEMSGDFVGTVAVKAMGAGGDATASAIVGDLVDIARGHRSFAFGVPAKNLSTTSF